MSGWVLGLQRGTRKFWLPVSQYPLKSASVLCRVRLHPGCSPGEDGIDGPPNPSAAGLHFPGTTNTIIA